MAGYQDAKTIIKKPHVSPCGLTLQTLTGHGEIWIGQNKSTTQWKLWLEEENTVYNIYNKTTLMVNGMHLYGASLPSRKRSFTICLSFTHPHTNGSRAGVPIRDNLDKRSQGLNHQPCNQWMARSAYWIIDYKIILCYRFSHSFWMIRFSVRFCSKYVGKHFQLIYTISFVAAKHIAHL